MGEPATTEGYIEVPGGQVWYRIAGTDRPGIPVLCLHGGPGMPHDYLEPLEDLASSRPVIFYDQLGCGRSDRPADRRQVRRSPPGDLAVLAEGLRDAELVIFENSSHMAFVEERESYIRVVEDFLGRVEAGVADET
jgi:pimeloyl-ACP methyl ester carboxylesterase